nr:DUF418 domain-containing protein [uncultured Sphingomonas sp.]
MTATSLPDTSSARIFSLDAIRGVAVMGIFSVNIIAFAMIEAAYFNPAAYGGYHGADLFVWASNMLLIDGKMRSLFSMLFGASMLLVIDRAEITGLSPAAVHFRRMAVLLLIGLVHYFLIWFGDILVLYAVCGMLAYAARGKSVRSLIGIGIALMVAHMALFSMLMNFMSHADAAAHAPGASQEWIEQWNSGLGAFYPSPPIIAADMATHLSPWGPTIHKLHNWPSLIVTTLMFVPDTIGLMLFGMAGYKSGFLTGQWSNRQYWRIAAILIPIGIASAAVLVAADIRSHFYIITMMTGFMVILTPFVTLQAVGYAALIILMTRHHGPMAVRVAAAGRAAFTNYLGTSIVATFVFYGWGLGYYGSASRAEAWLLVPLVWAIMLLWSKPWLTHFRYGPLEWVWRSLSRGQLQSMRR